MANKKIDYRFTFGKFNNMSEAYDPREQDEGYKILALTNILNMRPGTLQDCPECGLDLDGAQFAEAANDEINALTSRIQTDIRRLSETYIEPGFVSSVEFSLDDPKAAATDGTQDVTMRIILRSGTRVQIESTNTVNGLQHKTIKIDTTPFKSL
jgi:hypothetical protein